MTSTPTCRYARLDALDRLTCGKGLFAAYDRTLACGAKASSPATASGTKGSSRMVGTPRRVKPLSEAQRERHEAGDEELGPLAIW